MLHQMLDRLEGYLKMMYGQDATFREGQLEAIQSVLNCERTLVVQRTGWGKSLVYFLSTKLLRKQGNGPTVVISPLLSLMRNQVESANKLGLVARTIDSTLDTEELNDVERKLHLGEIDIIFISPERLGNEQFLNSILPSIKNGIGMLVIDEVHCISDWGHDFRPDYRRISRVINILPDHIPLLATTATANNRVIEDIKEQIGTIHIQRGKLIRDSLHLQSIHMPKKSDRLAWIAKNISNFKGSGIIYCSTISDCELVAKWLSHNGISAIEYHGQLTKEQRIEREELLLNNEVKALVANIALGMGFDKEDIGFVIHFQIPSSIITYYQQIGRAGRKLKDAYIVLLHGEEDEEIQNYFIRNAFPSQAYMLDVVNVIENSHEGLSVNQICELLNLSKTTIEQCLKLLLIDSIIMKERSKYSRTLTPLVFQQSRITNVITNKEDELRKMKEFVFTDQCLMRYIINELDDNASENCGKCSNCAGNFVEPEISEEERIKAEIFIQSNIFNFEPRKQWSTGKRIPEDMRSEKGIVLSRYSDSGWGKLVRSGKYRDNRFNDQLVSASYRVLQNEIDFNYPEEQFVVMAIPSLKRPQLVKEFAQKLAAQLNLPFVDAIRKVEDRPEQKTMNNSFQQEQNVRGSIAVDDSSYQRYNVLLIDDMVDSRWTFTVASYLLKEKGYNKIIPFALSSTAERG